MQKLMIIEPKKIERQIDAFVNNDPEGKFIFRLCSLKIFLNDSTYTTESLGRLMQSSPRSVAKWIHDINKAGDIEILRDKEKPGRSARLNEKQMVLLQRQLQKHPGEFSLDANLWDGKTLSHHIKKQFGINLRVRQCQRLFSKLGFSLKRGRTVVAKGDTGAKKAFKKTSLHSKKGQI
jgi:transposase